MSAINEYINSLTHDCILSTALIGGLYLNSIKQDSLPGGEAELELVREQLELMRQYREIQERRITLAEDLVGEIESQQQDVGTDH